MRKHYPLLLLASLLLVATSAGAGPLDDLVGEVSGLDQFVWWAQLVALGSAVCALATAMLPTGLPGTRMDKVRRILNYVACNWGNARNRDE